jgi:hypothetical protein
MLRRPPRQRLSSNGLLVKVTEHSHGTFQLPSTSPISRHFVQVALSLGTTCFFIALSMLFDDAVDEINQPAEF